VDADGLSKDEVADLVEQVLRTFNGIMSVRNDVEPDSIASIQLSDTSNDTTSTRGVEYVITFESITSDKIAAVADAFDKQKNALVVAGKRITPQNTTFTTQPTSLSTEANTDARDNSTRPLQVTFVRFSRKAEFFYLVPFDQISVDIGRNRARRNLQLGVESSIALFRDAFMKELERQGNFTFAIAIALSPSPTNAKGFTVTVVNITKAQRVVLKGQLCKICVPMGYYPGGKAHITCPTVASTDLSEMAETAPQCEQVATTLAPSNIIASGVTDEPVDNVTSVAAASSVALIAGLSILGCIALVVLAVAVVVVAAKKKESNPKCSSKIVPGDDNESGCGGGGGGADVIDDGCGGANLITAPPPPAPTPLSEPQLNWGLAEAALPDLGPDDAAHSSPSRSPGPPPLAELLGQARRQPAPVAVGTRGGALAPLSAPKQEHAAAGSSNSKKTKALGSECSDATLGDPLPTATTRARSRSPSPAPTPTQSTLTPNQRLPPARLFQRTSGVLH